MDKNVSVKTFTKAGSTFTALVWSDGSLIDVIEENDKNEEYPTTIKEALQFNFSVIDVSN